MALLLAEVSPLVHVNAALNSLATVLLVIGYTLIKQRNETAHKWVMLAAFDVSAAFLVCYLYYHFQVGSVKFTAEGLIRYVYYFILASHVLLAMTVPFLAGYTIWLGWKAVGLFESDAVQRADSPATQAGNYRARHRRIARITFPIWLYVSVTGVVVYLMLYHLWRPEGL